MTTAVIGATGRVGSEVVRRLLARGDAVTALVRDPDKARRVFGEPDRLRIRPTRLDDRRDLDEALEGIRTVFIARLSVLNASADSLGINQRAHHSIDLFAASTAVPYSTSAPRSSRRRCSPRRARCAPRTRGRASPAAVAWR